MFLQFFDMSRHDAVKALNVYKRAGQQVYSGTVFGIFCMKICTSVNCWISPLKNCFSFIELQAEALADFYEYCKGLDLARTFQFPTLRQVPFGLIVVYLS